MVRAQVTLIPSESKKLVADAIAETDLIKKAREKGIIVVHPSSTTLFLIERLIGRRPQGIWVCGLVLPKGLCISREYQREYEGTGLFARMGSHERHDMGQNPFAWVLEKGVFQTGIPLVSLLSKMGKGDVYVKGANAVDPDRKVGVLYGSVGAGTVGRVIAASRRKGFTILLPIGLEKLIPTSIAHAAKRASLKAEWAMGIPVGLIPVPGTVVTEVEAVSILSGATATVIGAGGLAGAEGAVTFVIRGSKEKVDRALQAVRAVKGATLPEVLPGECPSCRYATCHLRPNRQKEQTI
ncbi:MAG: hypothetical protein A2156_01380 [Deltaproteobacteria bacterium RBG_16_48_10]|nr:MAG: hypothetical protein A2156_01380 [Deltaproteobacteria bacterium RBG_16_48_10]